ncbi:MAG: NfeD family protein [Prevotella sp.]|nr:NfeD family protein [Prevotella sp.]
MIDYFIQHLWQAWALVSLVCLILELTNGDLYILCCAIGAIFGAIASAFGVSFWMQIIVFAIFSLLSIFFVRPVALRWLHKGEDKRLSNAEALIGRVGIVSETILADGYGRVAIDGDDWKALSLSKEEIVKGEKVRVVSMESIILTVEKA